MPTDDERRTAQSTISTCRCRCVYHVPCIEGQKSCCAAGAGCCARWAEHVNSHQCLCHSIIIILFLYSINHHIRRAEWSKNTTFSRIRSYTHPTVPRGHRSAVQSLDAATAPQAPAQLELQRALRASRPCQLVAVAYISELELVMKSIRISPSNLCAAKLWLLLISGNDHHNP
jgi:hypothetical protein